MVLQNVDENSMDCEENEVRSVADGGGDSRADDGGEKETVGFFGAYAQGRALKNICRLGMVAGRRTR